MIWYNIILNNINKYSGDQIQKFNKKYPDNKSWVDSIWSAVPVIFVFKLKILSLIFLISKF